MNPIYGGYGSPYMNPYAMGAMPCDPMMAMGGYGMHGGFPITPYENLSGRLYEHETVSDSKVKYALGGGALGLAAGAAAGAKIGAVGGWPGALIGLVVGTAIGYFSGKEDGKYRATLGDARDDGRLNGSPLMYEHAGGHEGGGPLGFSGHF